MPNRNQVAVLVFVTVYALVIFNNFSDIMSYTTRTLKAWGLPLFVYERPTMPVVIILALLPAALFELNFGADSSSFGRRLHDIGAWIDRNGKVWFFRVAYLVVGFGLSFFLSKLAYQAVLRNFDVSNGTAFLCGLSVFGAGVLITIRAMNQKQAEDRSAFRGDKARQALIFAVKAFVAIIAATAGLLVVFAIFPQPWILVSWLVFTPMIIHYYWKEYRTWCGFYDEEIARQVGFNNLADNKGSAHYATAAEIRQHVLDSDSGLFMWRVWASDTENWIQSRYTGATSILTISPSGGGKFVTAIAPVLLTSPASFLVNDPKGEIYAVTAKYRRSIPGHQVFLLDPFGVTGQPTNCYNPLEDLDSASATFDSDVATIAGTLIVTDEKQPFFSDSARRLVAGLIVYVCSTPGHPRTLIHVLELMHLGEAEFLALMMELKESSYRVAQFAATPFLSKTPSRSTAEGLNTARTQLDDFLPYGNIERILSRRDFSFRDLKQRGMTIYVVLPQAEAFRFNRFTRLLFGWGVKLLQAAPANTSRPPACLLIDEMATSIGEVDIIKQQFALARGYGFQLWGIFQDVNQMKETFGQDGYRTVLNNAGLTQYFATSDETTIATIQQRAGMKTRVMKQQQINPDYKLEGQSFYLRPEPDGAATEALPLLTVQEIQGLSRDRAIIFKNGLAATVLQSRSHYRENRTLRDRAAPNPFGG